MINFELPFVPVSNNSSYRTIKGRIIKSKRLREYEVRMKEELSKITDKIVGNVKLNIEVRYKDKRKRDIDNVLKSLLDSLKDNVFEDDSCVEEIKIKKVLSANEDKTIINISAI